MDSFELNKVLGAVLGTCLVLLALNITAGAIFTPTKPAKPGYEIAVPDHPAEEAKGPAEEAPPIEVLLASATVERGENVVKKCAACHTFTKGGPNRVGPNLWGIVGRKHASEAGFNYSAAMQKMSGNWTIDELNKFLISPKAFVPGTAMSFAGLRDKERADAIAYLNSLSDNPAPLPTKAAETPAAAPAAAAPAPAAPAAPAPAAPATDAPKQ